MCHCVVAQAAPDRISAAVIDMTAIYDRCATTSWRVHALGGHAQHAQHVHTPLHVITACLICVRGAGAGALTLPQPLLDTIHIAIEAQRQLAAAALQAGKAGIT